MSEPPRPAGGTVDGDGRPPSLVPIVTVTAIVVVVVVGVVMAVALRGGATRDDVDGLVNDVEVFTTVVLSSRPPERAYDHLSADCRASISFDEFATAVEEERAALERRLGIDLGALAVAEVSTRDVADRRGEALISVEEIGVDEIPVGDPFELTGWSGWAYESGIWRAVDCDRPADLVQVGGR